MNIIDSHCHVYPEKIAAKASFAIGTFYDIGMAFDGSLARMKEAERRAGIERQIISSVATKWEQVSAVNRFIAGAVANGEGHVFGLGTVHPDSPDMEADVNDLLSLGLIGVKIHPDFQKVAVNDPRFMTLFEILRAKSLPVLIHTGDRRYDFSNPNRLIPVLKSFPTLTVIGAHFGGWGFWEEVPPLLAGFQNFVTDCSSSLYGMTNEAAKKAIATYGADRVLFGTDYPMWDPEREVERLLSLGLSSSDTEKITHRNAERVFRLGS